MLTVAIAGPDISVVMPVSITRASAQALRPPCPPPQAGEGREGATPAPALTTPWGEPDLQGIWTDETDTPLQRSPKYAAQEFFTAAQRAELDDARTAVLVNADADVHTERRGGGRGGCRPP